MTASLISWRAGSCQWTMHALLVHDTPLLPAAAKCHMHGSGAGNSTCARTRAHTPTRTVSRFCQPMTPLPSQSRPERNAAHMRLVDKERGVHAALSESSRGWSAHHHSLQRACPAGCTLAVSLMPCLSALVSVIKQPVLQGTSHMLLYHAAAELHLPM